jgi:hypothetical protein
LRAAGAQLAANSRPRASGTQDGFLLETVRRCVAAGHPFQRTAKGHGVADRKVDMHPDLRRLPAAHVLRMVNEMVERGELRLCKGGPKSSNGWLDLPDGPLALSDGDMNVYEFKPGACPELWEDVAR